MLDLEQVSHHPAVQEITDVLCARIRNDDQPFFRIFVAYYLTLMASSMRTKYITPSTNDETPVNMFAVALGHSGCGKTYAAYLMEEKFQMGFTERFTAETLPILLERNLYKLASKLSAQKDTEEDVEFERLKKEFENLGSYMHVFDGAGETAIKDARQQLLLADVGAINFQVDEIGLRFTQGHVSDAMTVYLELYQQGMIKNRRKVATADKKPSTTLNGKTPANALLFGTPDELLNGAKTEEAFITMLSSGWGRRLWYAFGDKRKHSSEELTDDEIYQLRLDSGSDHVFSKWATHFTYLADPAKHNWLVDTPQDVDKFLSVTYEKHCNARSEALPASAAIARAEMKDRPTRAFRFAATLAFIDESTILTMDHALAAVKLVEESGEAFDRIQNRDEPYMKLAKHIADVGKDITHPDLTKACAYYPKNGAQQNYMLNMATAWGYKNNIIIRKTFTDGIEFFSGESLQKTDINKVFLSCSNHYADNFESGEAKFDDLPVLTQAHGMHWCNHGFKNNHRCEEDVLAGFNMLALDVDGTMDMDQAHQLLSEFTFMTYTTKRHTPTENRFRLIIPMNYHLKLDKADYAQFIENVFLWLPFKCDDASKQRSKKWESYPHGSYLINHGELLDVLPFIPKTSRNVEYAQRHKELQSLDNLERWFAQRMVSGDRNNQMIKFALAVSDNCIRQGLGYNDAQEMIFNFNNKMTDKLDAAELHSTVLVTVAKHFQNVTP